ncbi:MAG: hypothetical protein ACJ8G7_23635 [Rhizobacter sp.]
MKKSTLSRSFTALALAGCAVAPAMARTDVDVSIGINQPGAYGRVNIGDAGPPAVVYEQPVIVRHGPYAERRAPVYLYVPPYQQRDWARYCGRWGACAQPVYFVREQWVRERWDREHARRRDDDRHDRGRHEGWRDRR